MDLAGKQSFLQGNNNPRQSKSSSDEKAGKKRSAPKLSSIPQEIDEDA
jgi:hypothetical protein